MQSWLERRWYGGEPPEFWLRGLARLFGWLVARRRRAYLEGRKPVYRAPKPVVVVGNISVGGVGKTPLVIALCRQLQQRGFHPGVVSRGYGRQSRGLQRVTPGCSAQQVGDEPKLIFEATGCPVVVAEYRPQAVQALLEDPSIDLVIADDGLQHYALARDVEIAVIDGERGLGNAQLLPAGPLREAPQRLAECDLRICNGDYPGEPELGIDARMCLRPRRLRAIGRHAERGRVDQSLEWLQGRQVHAAAGIGHPQRFFASLESLGARVIAHPFPDHHSFSAADFCWPDDTPVVVTDKDAVKCAALISREAYALEVSVELDDEIMDRLQRLIWHNAKDSP
nr:tetraacyldisaccharide 4'-kinase [Pseudomarimonas arenosa]